MGHELALRLHVALNLIGMAEQSVPRRILIPVVEPVERFE